jgi:uncharacterized protein YrrD
MQFRTGTQVITHDRTPVGQVDRIVIDPVTQEVTHIVVRKGTFFTTDKVLALAAIAEADEEQVVLRSDIENLEGEPDFEERHYIPLDDPGGATVDPVGLGAGSVGRSVYYPPLGSMGVTPSAQAQLGAATIPTPYVVETERNIPERSIALEPGADVLDPDGNDIGDVEQVISEPGTSRVTHMVVVRGGLLNRDRKVVPVNWISRIQEEHIHLAVDNAFLDRLPPYEGAS